MHCSLLYGRSLSEGLHGVCGWIVHYHLNITNSLIPAIPIPAEIQELSCFGDDVPPMAGHSQATMLVSL
jgi:hypothetical protein